MLTDSAFEARILQTFRVRHSGRKRGEERAVGVVDVRGVWRLPYLVGCPRLRAHAERADFSVPTQHDIGLCCMDSSICDT